MIEHLCIIILGDKSMPIEYSSSMRPKWSQSTYFRVFSLSWPISRADANRVILRVNVSVLAFGNYIRQNQTIELCISSCMGFSLLSAVHNNEIRVDECWIVDADDVDFMTIIAATANVVWMWWTQVFCAHTPFSIDTQNGCRCGMPCDSNGQRRSIVINNCKVQNSFLDFYFVVFDHSVRSAI